MFCQQEPQEQRTYCSHRDGFERLAADLVVIEHQVELVIISDGKLHLDRAHHGVRGEPEAQSAVDGLIGVGAPLEPVGCGLLLSSPTPPAPARF